MSEPLPVPEFGQIQILEGSTFMVSDQRGDVEPLSIDGLYHEDTRYLSRFQLTVDGLRPLVLTSANVEHRAAAFFLTNPPLDGTPEHSLSIERYRSVGEHLEEVLVVRSFLPRPVRVELRLGCEADFADLFDVKARTQGPRGTFSSEPDPDGSALVFRYEHGPFRAGVRIHSSAPAAIQENELLFEIALEPHDVWKSKIQVDFEYGDERLEPISEEERAASRALLQWRATADVVREWRDATPRLEADSDLLRLVYERSIDDLASLRLRADVAGNQYHLPAAGLPWFMAIFGRDTLIASYQSLIVGPELARGALWALAGLQGIEVDEFRDEEPGRILHEIRFGELSVLGEGPHRAYYGTADATPLFLILLSEYWRFTRDDSTVRALRSNALRALAWIDDFGDLDNDGYVEYQTRSSKGLRNQGWKDSWNAVLFSNGEPAEPPIAMCEIQGYVYSAKLGMAEIAELVWGDPSLAADLRRGAANLRERFNRDFWIEDRGGFYAEALDADKRQVDSMTSNMGHLLWSGIVPQERAPEVVAQLFSTPMFSGWGVRTMSSDDSGFNPIAYHNGTVWPHDNSLIAVGLQRYGFREEANRIMLAMLEAASYTDRRLPEVFAGFPRELARFPIRYPTACSPQAWATAAPFLWLRSFLGIDVDHGVLKVDPMVPAEFGTIRLTGVSASSGRYRIDASGTEASIEAIR